MYNKFIMMVNIHVYTCKHFCESTDISRQPEFWVYASESNWIDLPLSDECSISSEWHTNRGHALQSQCNVNCLCTKSRYTNNDN